MSKSGISFNIEGLLNGLNNLEVKSASATRIYAETAKQKLVDESKENAPWTDRTGMARKSLNATTEKIDNGIRITLAHGVDYGLWLELAHEKRFAIVKPTIELRGNEVLKGYADLLNKMGY